MVDYTKKNYFEVIRNLIVSKNFLWLIITFGTILYLRQYLTNRSLWADELAVSLDIIRLPASNFLHQPLPNLQVAPFGFLIIQKLLISLFGIGEYVLRLYPFICGLISIWFFYRMAKIYLSIECVALALFTFIITPSLVYYSSEAKPYYTDVFFVLFSYVVIAQFCLNELDWDKIRNVGLLGAVIIWFSFPIIFILLGIIMPLLLASIIQRNWSKSLKLGVIIIYWFISFIINYIFLLHNLGHIKDSGGFWGSEGFSFVDCRSWLKVFSNVLEYPVGINNFYTRILAILFFFFGSYSFFKEDKKLFSILMTPLLIVFLACGFHIYSCAGRLVLFLIPILFLMIFKGIQMVSFKTGIWRTFFAFLLTGIFFFSSFFSTCKGFIKPNERQESRAVVSYIKANIRQQDVLYVYYGAVNAFEYYTSLIDFHPNNYIEEVGARNQPLKMREDDLKKLHGSKRVWLLFSNIWVNNINGINEKEYFLNYLSKSGGKMLDKFSNGEGSLEAGVYLFDLSNFLGTSGSNA